MSLSLSKLQALITSKGFVPVKYFALDDVCFYIELFTLNTADVFLMYIPSKYDFPMKPDGVNIFDISKIESKEGYANSEEAEEEYGDIGIHLPPDKSDDIEHHLENNYNKQISLKDISKDDGSTISSIYRQMRRLRNCVQNIKYKLGVFYKNYICAIRRDDTIDCFVIKKYPRVDNKRLVVIADLETFYEKSESLLTDVQTVRESIYKVLEKNQGMHIKIMAKLAQSQKELVSIPAVAEAKKQKYDLLLNNYRELLENMLQAEEKLELEIEELEANTDTNLQNDIVKAHHKARLLKEIDKIHKLKNDISKGLISLRDKRENSILITDDILFDNGVMFDRMIKNFAKLKEIS